MMVAGAAAAAPVSVTMMVCPSGAWRVSHSVAIVPAAPGRFSTMIRASGPSAAAMRSASSRAAMSVLPPGA
jgi:hypothetical protein